MWYVIHILLPNTGLAETYASTSIYVNFFILFFFDTNEKLHYSLQIKYKCQADHCWSEGIKNHKIQWVYFLIYSLNKTNQPGGAGGSNAWSCRRSIYVIHYILSVQWEIPAAAAAFLSSYIFITASLFDLVLPRGMGPMTLIFDGIPVPDRLPGNFVYVFPWKEVFTSEYAWTILRGFTICFGRCGQLLTTPTSSSEGKE